MAVTHCILKFKVSIKMGEKDLSDLSDSECGMVVDATQAGLSISESAGTNYWDFHPQPSVGLTGKTTLSAIPVN